MLWGSTSSVHYVRGSARHLEKGDLGLIMKACAILHNMTAEDERDAYGLAFDYGHVDGTTPETNVRWDHHLCYSSYLRRVLQVQNLEQHARLQSNLIEEI